MSKPAAVSPVLLVTFVLAFAVACYSTEEPPAEPNAFPEMVESADEQPPDDDRRRTAHAQAENSAFQTGDDEIIEEEEKPQDFGGLVHEGAEDSAGGDGSEPEG